MPTFIDEIRETLVPDRGAPFGPLPPLLVAMTVLTGLVDSFSYLLLGHVFVANMTGNVVFVGFALAGAGYLLILSSGSIDDLRWRGPTSDFARLCADLDAPGLARRAEALAAR